MFGQLRRYGNLSLAVFLLWCICGNFAGCRNEEVPFIPAMSPFEMVLNSGRIVMITRNDPHCYYSYRGQYMGFEYDLARAFADYIGVELVVKTEETWEGMVRRLRECPGAFIAANTTVTPSRSAAVSFCAPYMRVRPSVIVRRDDNAIRDLADLDGKKVLVPAGSVLEREFNALIRGGIDMTLIAERSLAEERIRRVVAGDVAATVAPSNIALINRRYYPEIRTLCDMEDERALAWAAHPSASHLIRQMDDFFDTIRKSGLFQEIYDRYYGDVDHFDYLDVKRYNERLKSRLPRYRGIIEAAAAEAGVDWKLIAAQMYQESHFKPRARSHAGALGLMQITLPVARKYGAGDPYDPAQNIRAGVRHFKSLYDAYDRLSGSDRLYIALAAYNVGRGHIEDARKIAASMGKDPDRWASLAEVLPLLASPEYHRRTVHGYCRGVEPVDYVRKIRVYYDILKHYGMTQARASVASTEKMD